MSSTSDLHANHLATSALAGTGNEASREQPGFLRLLWDAWNAYAHRAARYQSHVLLSLVYYLVLGPSALAARAAGTRLLDLSQVPRPSYWIERLPADTSLRAQRRQF